MNNNNNNKRNNNNNNKSSSNSKITTKPTTEPSFFLANSLCLILLLSLSLSICLLSLLNKMFSQATLSLPPPPPTNNTHILNHSITLITMATSSCHALSKYILIVATPLSLLLSLSYNNKTRLHNSLKLYLSLTHPQQLLKNFGPPTPHPPWK